MNDDTITKETVQFSNGNTATIILPSPKDKAEIIVDALALPDYKAVIVVIGGADSIDDKIVPKLIQMFNRDIARAAAKTNAVIVDGGTKSGVMSMMGEGVASRGYKSSLVGVAPAGLVEYPGSAVKGTPLEPHHSNFILVEGKTWGIETSMLFNIVNKLISKAPLPATAALERQEAFKTGLKFPSVAILVGGGGISRKEALYAVRQSIHLIVVEGSGGAADEISSASKNKETLPDDPVMSEIIADGKINLALLTNAVSGIERLIMRVLM